jgi:hypothetical protein
MLRRQDTLKVSDAYLPLKFVSLTGLEPANRNVKGYRLDHFGFRALRSRSIIVFEFMAQM